MCTCGCVHVCVCMHVTCAYVCVCMYVCVYAFMCADACTHAFIRVCMNIVHSTHTCLHVCMIRVCQTKAACMLGSELWRLKMNCFLMKGNKHNHISFFKQYINKMCIITRIHAFSPHQTRACQGKITLITCHFTQMKAPTQVATHYAICIIARFFSPNTSSCLSLSICSWILQQTVLLVLYVRFAEDFARDLIFQ